MPRNGSGTFSLPSGNPVVTGTTISSTVHNNTNNDIATAITQSIATTGVSQVTANIPMSTFKFTGLGNGTAATDSATLGQVQSQAANWAGTAGGTANAITLTPSPAITEYVAGQVFRFKSGASANTGATTIAISGLTAIALQVNGFACVGGEIMPNQWYELLVDASLTSAQLEQIGDSDGIKGPDITSAATINLDGAPGDFAHVTGTTTITAITLTSGHEYELVFDGALTLTHNATTLILPGAANITTADGDRAKFRGDGSGNTRCMYYTKASGTAVVSPASPGLSAPLAVLTPTAAANVDALNVFTSAYDNYLVILDGILPAADETGLRMRFAVAGSADSGANYSEAAASGSLAAATTSSIISSGVITAGKGYSGFITIANANGTTTLKHYSLLSSWQNTAAPIYGGRMLLGAYIGTSAISGIRFFWDGGSNFSATGKIRIYGYNNT